MCVWNNFARNAKSDSHLCVKIFCAPALFASFTIANEYQMSFVSASECVCILTWISTVWHRISIHSSRLGNNLCMYVECSVRWAALGKFRVSCSFTHTHTHTIIWTNTYIAIEIIVQRCLRLPAELNYSIIAYILNLGCRSFNIELEWSPTGHDGTFACGHQMVLWTA